MQETVITQSSEWQDEAFEALKVIKKNGYVSGDCFTYASVDRALLEGIGAECIWVDNQAQGLEIIAGFYVILEQAGIILIQQECMMDLNVLC